MYAIYRKWIEEHGEFVAAARRLRLDPAGARFPAASETDSPDEKTYLTHRAAYLQMGGKFLHDATDPRYPLDSREQLLVASEADEHLFHNAAVLWLEAGNVPPSNHLDYEEVLKALWASHLRAAHSAGPSRDSARVAALLKHCVGEADPRVIRSAADKALPQIRAAAHVTLGKIVARDATAFHESGAIRTHPGFWGLFLYSPLHKDDHGPYPALDSDTAFLRSLVGPGRVRDASDGQYQVYERVPRRFTAAETPVGVYLHRSKAHGRDDFLVHTTDTGSRGRGRQVMVACTKGVGMQPDCVPTATADGVDGFPEFRTTYDAGTRKDLPFTYPRRGQSTGDSSWRNLGFCLVRGDSHDEIATVDHAHFRAMRTAAGSARPALRGAADGFVEPYVCVEISSLPRNVARMPRVAAAVDDHSVPARERISWPAQVVTVGARETSLRLYREGSAQDYDYGLDQLELDEWERAYADAPAPAGLLSAVEADVTTMRTALPGLVAALQELDRGNPLTLDAAQANLEGLRRRMLLGARVVCRMVSCWAVFVEHHWATDSYTGSFSGRNFNSGPRDSNEWGMLALPSMRADQLGSSGLGPLRGHVDLGNLIESVGVGGTVQHALALYPLRRGVGPLQNVIASHDVEVLEPIATGAWLWQESTLNRLALELVNLLTSVQARTRGFVAIHKDADPQAAAKHNTEVSTAFVAAIREVVADPANRLRNMAYTAVPLIEELLPTS